VIARACVSAHLTQAFSFEHLQLVLGQLLAWLLFLDLFLLHKMLLLLHLLLLLHHLGISQDLLLLQ